MGKKRTHNIVINVFGSEAKRTTESSVCVAWIDYKQPSECVANTVDTCGYWYICCTQHTISMVCRATKTSGEAHGEVVSLIRNVVRWFFVLLLCFVSFNWFCFVFSYRNSWPFNVNHPKMYSHFAFRIQFSRSFSNLHTHTHTNIQSMHCNAKAIQRQHFSPASRISRMHNFDAHRTQRAIEGKPKLHISNVHPRKYFANTKIN